MNYKEPYPSTTASTIAEPKFWQKYLMHNNNKPEADRLIRDLLNPERVQPIDTQTIAHLNKTIRIDTALRKL
eukprot:1523229-Rhodomonas_salina.1